jgi:phosphoenolpyruvate-protein kinase (PTS system EI component)
MTSQHILSTRKLVRNLSHEACQKLVAEVLNLETSAEIKARLEKFSSQV